MALKALEASGLEQNILTGTITPQYGSVPTVLASEFRKADGPVASWTVGELVLPDQARWLWSFWSSLWQ